MKRNGSEQVLNTRDKAFHYLIVKGNNKEHVWTAITRLRTHYNPVHLLSEKSFNYGHAVTQHKWMAEFIETQATSLVNPIIDEHILEPMKKWHQFYEDGAQ